MNVSVDREFRIRDNPDNFFWEEYTRLWNNSKERSPFQSPGILKYFSSLNPGKVITVELLTGGKLTVAAVFRKEKSVYSFLSDIKTDVNFFIFDKECSEEDTRFYFSSLMKNVKEKKLAFILNYQPEWSEYMDTIHVSAKQKDLFLQNINYAVCPVIKGDNPGKVLELVNTSKQFKDSAKRLKNQLNAEVEIIRDGTGLEGWVNDFCDSHEQRWENTPTPSVYRKTENRKHLLSCLSSWCEDNILILFAVKAEEKRIGYVIGLLGNNTLIHHSTTFNPEYKKYSPGIALIYFMAEWISQQNICSLDFGYGGEAYKYYVANSEHKLSRIFISCQDNFSFILKSKLIKAVKSRNRLYSYYRKKIKNK